MGIGDAIEESGMLLRDGAGFVLAGDSGVRWRLDLARVPVDLVGKRVRVVGIRSGERRVDVDGVRGAASDD